MALSDISLVTVVIQKLLEQNIKYHLHPNLSVTSSAASPVAVGASATNLLTVYLHHVAEDPAYRNVTPPGGGRIPVRETPLALTLYYVLNAHHDTAHPATDALVQQRLLGYAAKTLHDYPLLTGQTRIDPVATQPTLFELASLDGDDNRIELVVRPLKPEESTQFWSNSDISRASLFFEARVILLKAAKPAGLAPPVLGLGLHVLSGGLPALYGSRSVVSFALPSVLAGGARTRVEVSPARVSLFDGPLAAPGAPHADNERLVLGGGGLGGGRRTLRLRSGDRTVHLDLDDPAANPAWNLVATDSHVTLSFQGSAQDARNSESRALLPGVYGVSVLVQRERETPAGPSRVGLTSNELPVAVAPQIEEITLGADPLAVSIRLIGEYLTRPAAHEPDLEISLSVQGEAFEDIRVRSAGGADALQPGTYDRVADGDGRVNTLSLLLTQALREQLAPGRPLSVRVVLNGVEAPPAFIEVTS
jgi:hypothetical protein